jgi:hypothetical protein
MTPRVVSHLAAQLDGSEAACERAHSTLASERAMVNVAKSGRDCRTELNGSIPVYFA